MIHRLLVQRISEFHHHVVNQIGELRVCNQRIEPLVFLFIVVDLTQHHDIVRLKRFKDGSSELNMSNSADNVCMECKFTPALHFRQSVDRKRLRVKTPGPEREFLI